MKRNKGILIVVSGFSGAGKGTLMKKLMSAYDNYALSISMTTRKPRPGEQEGKDYFYISKEEFEKHIANDELIEYARYVDNYYGTPKKYVEQCLSEGKDVILEIEIQGALKIKEKFPETLLLFVMPPNASELKKRLEGRGTEAAEVIAKRISRATEESEGIEQYDYIVVNDDIEQCVQEMNAIVKSAKFAVRRNIGFIEEIRQQLQDISKGEK